MSLCTDKISAFTNRRLGIISDDLGLERSSLVAPAQNIAAAEVNRLISLSGGLTYVVLSPERAAAFMLPKMVGRGGVPSSSKHFASVEAREGVTTGISAADRAATISILGNPQPNPRALIRPGHIFPIEASVGGTLARGEITEAALDLVKLAGFSDAALYLDLLNSVGELMSSSEANELAEELKIPHLKVSDIIHHRLILEPLVSRISEAIIPTRIGGSLRAVAYRSQIHRLEHVALVNGEISTKEPVLVRVQVENTVADVFGGDTPPGRQQILSSLKTIEESGSGVFLYLRRDSLRDPQSKAISANNNLAPMDGNQMRDYGVGAQILRDLGVREIELLSSTQRNLIGLDTFGLKIVRQRGADLIGS
jgi:3,4-dihydroxy 2-butanone 4-phosphate synthase/GTP cyclohydrolase II